MKKPQDSLENLFKAADILKKLYTENHESIFNCYWQIAFIYNEEKEFNKALEYFKKLNTIAQKVFTNDESKIGDCLLLTAKSFFDLKNLNEGLNHLGKAIDQFLKLKMDL